jgi:3-hydroxyisobutyrate dehydrogenase
VTRVGWVGAGAMGTPMAACVARSGIDVIAYDIDHERLKVLAGSGVRTSAGITEAAFGADVLVVTVATPAQAEAVLFGPAGAADVLRPGSVVLMSGQAGSPHGQSISWTLRCPAVPRGPSAGTCSSW